MCDFSRVSAWFCDEKISLKKVVSTFTSGGNMSFVGTRPEAVKYVEKYKPEYFATLLLPAGITSEASIRYKDEAEFSLLMLVVASPFMLLIAIAIKIYDGGPVFYKQPRLGNLAEKTDEGRALRGTCGIGHTRWATHGEPSQINAHPHVSGNCTRSGSGEVESEVVGVHNGIIENYAELKDKLLKHGYTFYSETDTEVVIKLVDYYYRKYNLGPVDAIAKTMVRVRGSYALELMFRDYPGEICSGLRLNMPVRMMCSLSEGELIMRFPWRAVLN